MEPRYKTLRRIDVDHGWRFLTFSCYQRLPLLDSPHVRDRLLDSLTRARERCKFRLRAWVIMPNHVHLILKPNSPDWPVAEILRAIKQPHAQTTLREWKRETDPILVSLADGSGVLKYWQPGGGFDRNIRNASELHREVEYIHDNPVTRELVKERCDWPWSSARWHAGQRDGQIPLDL
jgi:putative transposase